MSASAPSRFRREQRPVLIGARYFSLAARGAFLNYYYDEYKRNNRVLGVGRGDPVFPMVHRSDAPPLKTKEVMETILCAAIWYKNWSNPVHSPVNINTGIVLCGYRHGHIIGQLKHLTGKTSADAQPYVQGFLTSRGRFVDREEACEIATAAGQVSFDRDRHLLYSEDLY